MSRNKMNLVNHINKNEMKYFFGKSKIITGITLTYYHCATCEGLLHYIILYNIYYLRSTLDTNADF